MRGELTSPHEQIADWNKTVLHLSTLRCHGNTRWGQKWTDGSRNRWLWLKLADPLICFRHRGECLDSLSVCVLPAMCGCVSCVCADEIGDKHAQACHYHPVILRVYCFLSSGSNKSEIPNVKKGCDSPVSRFQVDIYKVFQAWSPA